MAKVVVNNPVGSNVIYRTQYTSVWVKPYYESRWRYVPYMFPESSTESSAPSDSEATLTWDYGRYVNLWSDPGATLLPLNIGNWIIKIQVHTQYGTYISWIGVVVGESIKETGIDVSTGYPRGEQIIECRGLEYLLERRNVLGTYVGDQTDWVHIPRTRDFNVSNVRRESIAGNRSAFKNSSSGTYLFSSDGNKWSNHDIINYLLAAFQPWMAYMAYGVVSYGPQFILAGQTSALRYIYEEHRLSGRNIRECLNALIDRRRGLGWKIVTNGVGPIYIYVFSLSQYRINGNGQALPQNPVQLDVRIHDDKWIEADYRISSMNQVDQIVVESDVPIRTCATLRFSDFTLEPAWAAKLDYERFMSTEDYNYELLAQHLIDNWDSVNYYGNDNINFYEFSQYAAANPAPFAFLSTDEFGMTPSELLVGYNKLDADGDSYISREDLSTFVQKIAYQLVSEDKRSTDEYAAVFSEFQVPKEWGWQGWAPTVRFDGTVDISNRGYYWNHNVELQRFLPFITKSTELDVEREYVEPFCVIEKPYEPRSFLLALMYGAAAPYTFESAKAVYKDATMNLFTLFETGGFITWDAINTGLNDNPPEYIQLDKTQQRDLPTCSLRMGDSGMKIIVKSEYNHVFAKGHEAGGTFEKDPVFDYRDINATVFFNTDMTPRVAIPVYVGTYRDEFGDTRGISSPTGKQIYIQVPGKEVWCVAPWTITGLDGVDPVYFNEGAAGIIRDDTEDLRSVALMAYVWYGQQRASVTFTIKNQLSYFQVGHLVRSTVSGWSHQRIGTCVTSITRDYQSGTHQVSTGFGELDPTVFVPSGADK